MIATLPSWLEVIDPKKTGDALTKRKLDADALGTPGDVPSSTIGKLRKAASAMGADAIVLGRVSAAKRGALAELRLVAVSPSLKVALVDEAVAVRKKPATRAAQWKELLRPMIDHLAGDAEGDSQPAAGDSSGAAADGPASESVAEADADVADEMSGRAPGGDVARNDGLFVGFLGLDLGGRQFHYNQRITNANLRPFDLPQGPLLPATPGAVLAVNVYPLAKRGWGFAGDVGLGARAGYNLARAQVGTSKLDTRWFSWDVDLRARVRIKDNRVGPTVELSAGLGRLLFDFKDPPGATGVADTLPGVDYRYLRFGADGRIPVGRWAFLVGAAYRHLLTKQGQNGTTVPAAGSVGDHFPRADIKGLDARIGGTLSLGRRLEARLVLNYVRFWATFHPRAGDTYVAGGGLEQMMNLDAGIAAFF